jgi:hypothetical protein
MRRIGIDHQLGEIYQSAGNYWRLISPGPVLFDAVFDPAFPLEIAPNSQVTARVFREDAFDPVTRLRRGRFYQKANEEQPSKQFVFSRAREEYEDMPRPKDLFTFDQYQYLSKMEVPKFVALGSSESLWRIVANPERTSTGEFLFVLKARHNFGILPEIDHTSVPEEGRAKVIETLSKLTDAAHRESPGSIIDRARDSAQSCLATWAVSEFGDAHLLHEDLGPLLDKIAKKREMVAFKAAEIVRRLHSRVKPNEQERRGLRPPMEADAELALNSVAFLIRELGWAAD